MLLSAHAACRPSSVDARGLFPCGARHPGSAAHTGPAARTGLAGLAALAVGALAPGAARAQAPGAPSAPTASLFAPPARGTMEIELQAAQVLRNDVQIPNDARGTRFPLDRLTGEGPFAAARIELTWRLSGRDELRALIAPLRVDGNDTLGQAVAFQGRSFAAGRDTQADYRFDSYRLTWRRLVVDEPGWRLRLGLTGKIRDARIALRQGATFAEKTDTGFVPLLHAQLERPLGERTLLVADVDGLASGQGRAIDLGLKLRYTFDADWSGSVSWRLLDGGADNSTLYNMARFQFLGIGVQRRF